MQIKYAWVIPIKDKKGVSIVNAFRKILDDSKRKPNKIWADKLWVEANFIVTLLKNG